MMPCVAKDTSDLNSQVPKERPKNIYKPKYHAFSIDSLVGNNENNDNNSNNTNNEKVSEDKQMDMSSKNRTTPKPPSRTPPPTPPTTESPLNYHKILNENKTRKTDEYLDYSIERTAKLMAKNGILRSYMTANHPNYSSHITSHLNNDNSNYIFNSNQNTENNTLFTTNHNIVSHTNRFNDSISNNPTKFNHILNMRSDLNTDNNRNNSLRNSPPIMRSSSPEMSNYSTGGSSLQSSTFNANQYYCNPLYCRPFEDRLVQTNPFLPQVCDYKMLSTKSPDMCCNPYRKPKRIRTAFSPGQLLRLEEIFERNRYVVGCERKQLARDLNLSETQIKVWFQNRRTKHKRERHQQNGNKRSGHMSAMMSNCMPVHSMSTGNTSDGNDVDVDEIDQKY